VGNPLHSGVAKALAASSGKAAVSVGDLVTLGRVRVLDRKPGPIDAVPISQPDGSLVLPGEVVVSSHPSVFCIGGIGALPVRLAPSQLAAAKSGQPVFVRVPPSVRVSIGVRSTDQQLGRGIDAALAAWHAAGSGTLLGAGVELTGDFFAQATTDTRATVAAFGSLMGAATLVIEADLRLLQEIRRFCDTEFATHTADKGAVYAATFATTLGATDYWALSEDFLPLSAAALRGTPIDRVVVAGPGGGTAEHLTVLARMLRGRSKHAGVELTIQPESPSVEERVRRLGILSDLERFGAKMIPSSMTAPLAKSHDRVLAVGVEAWLESRKVEQAEAWLAGPYLAGAAALTGVIAEPDAAMASPAGDSKVSARHAAKSTDAAATPPDAKGKGS